MLCNSTVKQAMELIAKKNIGKQTKGIDRTASYLASEFLQVTQCQLWDNDESDHHHNTHLLTLHIVPAFDGLMTSAALSKDCEPGPTHLGHSNTNRRHCSSHTAEQKEAACSAVPNAQTGKYSCPESGIFYWQWEKMTERDRNYIWRQACRGGAGSTSHTNDSRTQWCNVGYYTQIALEILNSSSLNRDLGFPR